MHLNNLDEALELVEKGLLCAKEEKEEKEISSIKEEILNKKKENEYNNLSK
jgi:hypothetical protein